MPSHNDLVEDLVFQCLEALGARGPTAIDEILTGQSDAVRDEARRMLATLTRVGLAGDEPPANAPEKLGPYRLLERIGAGAMGVVYRARRDDAREGEGTELALKLLQPGLLPVRGSRVRFEREIAALRELDHPGICPILDDGEVEGVPFLAMPFVPGESLREIFARGPAGADATRRERLLRTLQQVALALHHAHERGFVHRDVKPANVLVRPDGHAVLLDFGLARVEQPRGGLALTVSGGVVGTPAYMAPEQVAGRPDVDRRCDVYALGAVLFEGLTGRLPHEAPTRESLYRRILASEVVRPSHLLRSVPVDLDVVCLTALERDAGRRYQTAQDFAADLERVQKGLTPVAKLPGPLLRARRWVALNPLPAVLLAVSTSTALVVLLLAVGLAEQRRVASARAVAALTGVVSGSRWSGNTIGDAATRLREALQAYDAAPEPLTASAVQAALAADAPAYELAGHEGLITGIEFAGNDRLLSTSLDGTARLWDLQIGGPPLLVRHGGPIRSAALSPSGTTFATAGDADGRLCLWDAGSGALLWNRAAHALGGGITVLRWSDDGRWLLSGSSDGTARVWTLDGEPFVDLPAQEGSVTAAMWIDDTTFLVGTAASREGSPPAPHARCWRLHADLSQRLTLGPVCESAGVRSFARHPTRPGLVLVVGDEPIARLWNLADDGRPRELSGGNSRLVAGGFLADGESVFTANLGNRVAIHELAGQRRPSPSRGIWKLLAGRSHPRIPWILVGGDQGVLQLLSDRGAVLRTCGGGRIRGDLLAWAPDGTRFASTTWDDRILVFDQFSASRPTLPVGQQVESVAWIDDRTCVTGAVVGQRQGGGNESAIDIWREPASGPRRLSLRHRQHPAHLVRSPDGRQLLALWAGENTTRVESWRNTDAGCELAGLLETSEQWLCPTATFVADGRQALLCEASGRASLWDLATLTQLQVLDPAGREEAWRWMALAATGDGESVWAGGSPALLHRFDRQADGSYRGAVPIELRARIRALALLPDGSLLVASSRGLLRGPPDGRSFKTFEGTATDVRAISWTTLDGVLWFASAHESGVVRLWREDGTLLRELRGHCDVVTDVAFSPDGARLLSGSWDGTARIWPVRTEDVVALARRQLREYRNR